MGIAFSFLDISFFFEKELTYYVLVLDIQHNDLKYVYIVKRTIQVGILDEHRFKNSQ